MDLDITCSKCGEQFTQPLGEITDGHERSCPRCGTAVRFLGTDGALMVDALEQLRRAGAQVTVKVTE